MKEESEHNLSDGDSQAGGEPDDEFIPEDAQPLCLRCLKPCHPLQYYCDKCGSTNAVNPLTPYIGFVNIPFNYGIFITMWRKTWYDENTSMMGRFIYLFMIAMFVPVFLLFGLPLLLVYKIPEGKLQKGTVAVLYFVAIVLFIFLMNLRIRGTYAGGLSGR